MNDINRTNGTDYSVQKLSNESCLTFTRGSEKDISLPKLIIKQKENIHETYIPSTSEQHS